MKARYVLTLVACGLFILSNATLADEPAQPDKPQEAQAQSDEQQTETRQDAQRHDKQASGPAFRANDLIGMTVKNAEGKSLGSISDLIVNQDGSIRYAALTRGGLVGIGNKMYAIPWDAFQVQRKAKTDAARRPDSQRVELGFRGTTGVQASDEYELTLHVDEKALDADPGFKEGTFPAQGNPKWAKHQESKDTPARQRRQSPSKQEDKP